MKTLLKSLSAAQMRELMFDQGCIYAEQLPGITPAGIKKMLESKGFWSWWMRRWQITDEVINGSVLNLTKEQYIKMHLDNLQPGLPVTLYVKRKEVVNA